MVFTLKVLYIFAEIFVQVFKSEYFNLIIIKIEHFGLLILINKKQIII